MACGFCPGSSLMICTGLGFRPTGPCSTLAPGTTRLRCSPARQPRATSSLGLLVALGCMRLSGCASPRRGGIRKSSFHAPGGISGRGRPRRGDIPAGAGKRWRSARLFYAKPTPGLPISSKALRPGRRYRGYCSLRASGDYSGFRRPWPVKGGFAGPVPKRKAARGRGRWARARGSGGGRRRSAPAAGAFRRGQSRRNLAKGKKKACVLS